MLNLGWGTWGKYLSSWLRRQVTPLIFQNEVVRSNSQLEIFMEPSKRKVVQRAPAHTVRLIHLPHLQPTPVEADSSLERDFVQIAALFPFADRIEHQPFTLSLGDRCYTPDFLLSFKDHSRLVVEVKPKEKVEGYRDLFDLTATTLEIKGLPFLVATDVQITASRAANARQIRRYAKTKYPIGLYSMVSSVVLRNPEGLTFSDACAKHEIPRVVLLHMVAKKLITLNSDLSINSNACVFAPKQFVTEESHAIQFASWFGAQIWK